VSTVEAQETLSFDIRGKAGRCKCPWFSELPVELATSRPEGREFESGWQNHQSSKRVHDGEPIQILYFQRIPYGTRQLP
jgi:hypothetical protein